jgi:hypothetical protein
MAIKTISQPAIHTPSNPFSRVLAAIRRVDEWLSPARYDSPEHPSATGVNASGELWMPLFMVAGAVRLTHPGLALQEGVRK